jgi:hypothetical protein
MKKLFLAMLCVGFVVLSASGSALAFSMVDRGETNPLTSGEYLFTVTEPENDNIWTWDEADRQALFDEINLLVEPDISGLDLYGKDGPGEDPEGEPIVVESDNGWLTGTWSTVGGTSIDFYTVKAATEWAIYWIEGGASSGTWSTEHVLNPAGKIPEISHLSLWNPSEDTVVPEPSTVLLLGIGILGVLGMKRKIKK